MKKIPFTKMVASGNDFVVVASAALPENLALAARQICDRKFGVGADGMLLVGKSRKADARMRIFNADGSEAEMCGNGARCVAYYLGRKISRFETKAGMIIGEVNKGSIRIKLTDPSAIKPDLPLRVSGRMIRVNFINTGVPHAVIFVEGLEKIDVASLGRSIRYAEKFAPQGTNVDFVEILSRDSCKIRTYERGVEGETLACGTGSVAAALVLAAKAGSPGEIKVQTKSGEVLKVYFNRSGDRFDNVWLEGRARMVFTGEFNPAAGK